MIKSSQPLFDQVGQLRRNSYLQWWSDRSCSKANMILCRTAGSDNFLPAIRFNMKQWSGNAPPEQCASYLSPQSSGVHRWKNNLSRPLRWICSEILGPFRSNCLQVISERKSGTWSGERQRRAAQEWQSQIWLSIFKPLLLRKIKAILQIQKDGLNQSAVSKKWSNFTR